jgi:hypothetical protein
MATAVLAGALAGCAELTDNEYSIRLIVVATPDHVQRVQTYKEQTEQEAGWTGLYVLVKGNFSELYWGKYPSKEAAQGDLNRARNFRTRVGIQAYPKATVLPIPGSDTGPAEMNLANAKGVYTVLIATFHDVPERRSFAVENCKDLRQKGEEAYFYHTAVESIVTIGTFDASAIKKVRAGPTTNMVINSKLIEQVLKKHPLMAENGRSMRVLVPDILSGKAVWVDKPSYVIAIPQNAENEWPTNPSENIQNERPTPTGAQVKPAPAPERP